MLPDAPSSGSYRRQASPRLSSYLTVDQRNRFAPLLGLAATLLATGCDGSLSPERSAPGAPNFLHGGAHPRIAGLGTLGAGSATPGGDRQEFDFDVGADLSGRLFYRDWAVVRADGTVGTVTVDPTDSSTAITAYRDGSAACANATGGAEFDGTGRLDIGDLVGFTAAACDNGATSGVDFFRIDVQPPHEYSHGGMLSSGHVVKSGVRHFYVSPTGSDVNPCTSPDPCHTMQRVAGLLGPGDVAHFAPGTYNWETPQIISASGTANARVTYVSDTRWGAKLIVSGTVNGVCGIMKNTGDYVAIVGFDMTYGGPPCASGLLQDGNYGRIIGNRVHDLTGPDGTGVGAIIVDCCKYTLTGNQVIGNVVHNIGPFSGDTSLSNNIHGIYLAGPGNSAVNNIVTRAAAACINTWHGAERMVISNNTVANCGRFGIQISADASVTVNDFTTVSNNIVVNNGRFGIHEWLPTGPNNVYYNNIVYNNPEGNVVIRGGGAESGTITLRSNEFAALFVNYTGDMNGDYHLRPGVRGIDEGTTSCAPEVSNCVPLTDFDGLIRLQGTTWDIGAYEFIP